MRTAQLPDPPSDPSIGRILTKVTLAFSRSSMTP